MQRIVRFVAWLILAVLPLQGAAAASMRVCSMELVGAAAGFDRLSPNGEGVGADRVTSSPFSLSLSKGHGTPAGFDGLSPNGLGPGPGVEHGADHHAHAAQSDAAHHGSDSTLPDASHTCVVCALCGHGAAAPVTCTPALDSPAPASAPGWASVRLDSPSLPLPDKPPRA